MKNKNIVLISFLVSAGIFACSNNKQLPNNISAFVEPSVLGELFEPNTYIFPKISSSPDNYKFIKTFIDNKDLSQDYEKLLSTDNYTEKVGISIIDNQISFSSGYNIFQYNLSSNKLDNSSLNCLPLANNERLLFDSYCKYRGFKFKKGKDNITYLANYQEIFKLEGKYISKIYDDEISKHGLTPSIAVDKNSNIYIISSYQKTLIKINPSGKPEWSRSLGLEDPEYLQDIEIDNNGNIYFIDGLNKQIKKMDSNGNILAIIGGGDKTSANISGTKYKLPDYSVKLSMDNNDNIYLIEKDNNRVLKYDIKTNMLSYFAGIGSASFRNDNLTSLISPLTMDFDSENNAYIFDSGNKSIKKIDAKTNQVSLTMGLSLDQGDGNNLSDVFFKNISNIYSKDNNLYIGENDRIRKIDTNGVTTTIAGNGQMPPNIMVSAAPIFTESDLPADKSIVYDPQILHISKNNDIYISERNWIRKISNNRLNPLNSNIANSNSITEDNNGNLYFSSFNNIKKVDKKNNTEIFAGQLSQYESLIPSALPSATLIPTFNPTATPLSPSSEYSKRGPLIDGSQAKGIYNLEPRSIVSDSKNNIYAIVQYSFNIYNSQENQTAIIKISPDGIIKNIAGNPETSTIFNDSTIALAPRNLIVDKQDNVYFIDNKDQYSSGVNNFIKKIDATTGQVSVYGGKSTTLNQDDIKNEYITFKNGINDITVDDNGTIYFLAGGTAIYKIE